VEIKLRKTFFMAVRLLTENDLEINRPLKWPIYNSKGKLLFKRGTIFHSGSQIREVVASRSIIKVLEDEVEAAIIDDSMSPFQQIELVLNRIDDIYQSILQSPSSSSDSIDDLLSISKDIITLCKFDIDATIGSIHVGETRKYTVIHPLSCAIISYSIASKLGLSKQKITVLICAALTSNLGMYELQNELVDQKSTLTKEQRKEVEKHTMRSAVLLKRIGTTDELWMEIVLQHHEKEDGSGYPRRLSGEDFIQEARILGIADRYHAMVSPREYREGFSPTEALKRIFVDRGKEVDEGISALLIKEMGIFPPGSFVTLANDEIAIVVRRSENRKHPLVKSIIDAGGKVYKTPISRDSSDKAFRITGLSNPPKKYQQDLLTLWDY